MAWSPRPDARPGWRSKGLDRGRTFAASPVRGRTNTTSDATVSMRLKKETHSANTRFPSITPGLLDGSLVEAGGSSAVSRLMHLAHPRPGLWCVPRIRGTKFRGLH